MILKFSRYDNLHKFLKDNNYIKTVENIDYKIGHQSTRKCGPYIYWKTNFPEDYKFNWLIIKRVKGKKERNENGKSISRSN